MNTKSISLRIIFFLSLTVTALCPTARGMEGGSSNSLSVTFAQKAFHAPKLVATKMYEHPWYSLFGATTFFTACYISRFVYREIKEVHEIARKGQEAMPAPTSYQTLGQKIEFVEKIKDLCDPEINRFMQFDYTHTQGKKFYIGRLTYEQNPTAADVKNSYTFSSQLQKITGSEKTRISLGDQLAIAEEIYFRLDATRRIQNKYNSSDNTLKAIQGFLEKQLPIYQQENQEFRVEAYEKSVKSSAT